MTKLEFTKDSTLVCVPIVGKNKAEIISECIEIKKINPDIVEWRADYLENAGDVNEILSVLKEIKTILEQYPLIFTLRIEEEGGQIKISQDIRLEIILKAMKTLDIDVVDVEFINEKSFVDEVISCAKSLNVKVIISNHNFLCTPTKEEIYSRLTSMKKLGGDIVKVAFMPKNITDVISQISATNEFKQNNNEQLIISISMSKIGMISRVGAEVFGSCITFCSVGNISAPGQIKISELRTCMGILKDM